MLLDVYRALKKKKLRPATYVWKNERKSYTYIAIILEVLQDFANKFFREICNMLGVWQMPRWYLHPHKESMAVPLGLWVGGGGRRWEVGWEGGGVRERKIQSLYWRPDHCNSDIWQCCPHLIGPGGQASDEP
jgi:hypothetical protein